MCITLFSARQKPTKETLRICFANNKDGAGFAFAKDGKLSMEKGFFTFDEFWTAYRKIPQDVPFIVHFRKVSSGPKDKKNCHPWQIDENHAFAHNGTIKQFDTKNDKLSDTGKFVNEMLKPLFEAGERIWLKPFAKTLLENYMGLDNKGIILSNNGEYLILHEERGMWAEGVWYSNDSFRRKGIQSWGDFIAQKKTYSPAHIAMEYYPSSIGSIDSMLIKLNKENSKNKWSTGDLTTFRKAYTIKMSPYAHDLVDRHEARIKKTKTRSTMGSTPFSLHLKPITGMDHNLERLRPKV